MQSAWPTNWVTDEGEIRELLSRWRRGHVQVREYVVSHLQLMIRLHRLEYGMTKNCYLFCKACERVEFDKYPARSPHLGTLD